MHILLAKIKISAHKVKVNYIWIPLSPLSLKFDEFFWILAKLAYHLKWFLQFSEISALHLSL